MNGEVESREMGCVWGGRHARKSASRSALPGLRLPFRRASAPAAEDCRPVRAHVTAHDDSSAAPRLRSARDDRERASVLLRLGLLLLPACVRASESSSRNYLLVLEANGLEVGILLDLFRTGSNLLPVGRHAREGKELRARRWPAVSSAEGMTV